MLIPTPAQSLSASNTGLRALPDWRVLVNTLRNPEPTTLDIFSQRLVQRMQALLVINMRYPCSACVENPEFIHQQLSQFFPFAYISSGVSFELLRDQGNAQGAFLFLVWDLSFPPSNLGFSVVP